MVESGQERHAEEPWKLSGKPFWSSLLSQGEQQRKNSRGLGVGTGYTPCHGICLILTLHDVPRYRSGCGEHQHVNKGDLSGTQKVNDTLFGSLCGHSLGDECQSDAILSQNERWHGHE